jgi:hypothetical protein
MILLAGGGIIGKIIKKKLELDEFKRNISSYLEEFDEEKYDLNLYYHVINSPRLTKKQIKDILCWKLAGKKKYKQLSKRKRKLIDRTIKRLPDINNFKIGKISKSDFDKVLKHISPRGPIIRLFLLHICKPKKYELFDQHVFRAFYYFKTGEIDRGSVTFSKAKKYYSEYCSFFSQLCEELGDRYKPKQIDSALMVFGKKLKKM